MQDLCLIFDLDGTLVDSELLCNQALIDLLPAITDPAEHLVRHYRGKKLASILIDIENRFGIKLPADFEIVYRRRVDQLFQSRLKPMSGVPEMLEALEYPRCIASSGPMAKIRMALTVAGLSHYFENCLFSSYDIGCWKPDPGLFIHAAQKMGFLPEQCVVIEDSDVGVEAARSARMQVLKYTPGREKHETQTIMFSDMRLLPELLHNL